MKLRIAGGNEEEVEGFHGLLKLSTDIGYNLLFLRFGNIITFLGVFIEIIGTAKAKTCYVTLLAAKREVTSLLRSIVLKTRGKEFFSIK